MPHTVEEAYEVADAALAGDDAKLLDELGDLLFQVYFLALLLEEQGAATSSTWRAAIHAKLVRRHPHVFGDVEARPPGGCARTGSGSSASRRGARASSTTCPRRCRRCSTRARCSGARRRSASSTRTSTGALADLDDELRELRRARREPRRDEPDRGPPSSATCSSLR